MSKTKALATYAIIAIFLLVPIEISFAQSDIDEAQDLYLAKRSFGDGFYEIALKHLQKYLQENPECDKGEVQVFIARSFLKLNKFGEALHALQEVLDRSRHEDELTAQATYWTAQTYFTAKDYENALNFFQKIIEQYPTSELLTNCYAHGLLINVYFQFALLFFILPIFNLLYSVLKKLLIYLYDLYELFNLTLEAGDYGKENRSKLRMA